MIDVAFTVCLFTSRKAGQGMVVIHQLQQLQLEVTFNSPTTLTTFGARYQTLGRGPKLRDLEIQ